MVKVVDEEMDGIAQEQCKRLRIIEDELEDVKRRLGRIWNAIETSDLDVADASDRIKEHRERKERLEDAAADARAILSERRAHLDDVKTISAYAKDMRDFLKDSELTERRAFIESFVKEIVVMPGDALMRYTIPISQSTPKTELLVGGRSEEFWVGNEAEASSQLVGDGAVLSLRCIASRTVSCPFSRSWTFPWAMRRPLDRMATLSHTCSTSCRRWLDRRTVCPLLPNSCIRDRTSAMPAGSSPLVGSSRNSTSGSPSSAYAMPSLCFMPME